MRNDFNITHFDPGGVQAPWDWYDEAPLVGAEKPWSAAPIMSRFTCILAGSRALYVKVANAGANADWAKIVNATGDFSISGTLTVGDLVITA